MIKKAGFIGVLACAVAAFPQENYSQWSYYRNVSVNTTSSGANVPGNVLEFPMLVRLTSSNADVFSNSRGRGADIRFAKANGTTALPYQIEHWDSAGQTAEIWVGMDTVYGNNGSQSLRMYWGKTGAVDSSNGPAVFDSVNGYQLVSHLSGALPTDATPRDWPLTQNGTGTIGLPSDTLGVIGRALSFLPGAFYTTASGGILGAGPNGNSGSYTVTSSSAGLDVPDGANYTISAWANAHSGAGTIGAGMVFCKSARYYVADTLSGSSYVWELAEYVPGVGKRKIDAALTMGAWHHLVGVRNGSAMALYVDGTPFSAVTTEPDTGFTHQLKSAGIGRDNHAFDDNTLYDPNAGNGMYFSGAIDEVEFSNVARGADWINLSYQNQKPGSNVVSLGTTNVPAALSFRSANPSAYRVFADGMGGPFTFRAPAGASAARMRVEDMGGRRVAEKLFALDESRVTAWDGKGLNGNPLPTGMYVVRMAFIFGRSRAE